MVEDRGVELDAEVVDRGDVDEEVFFAFFFDEDEDELVVWAVGMMLAGGT